MDQDPPAQHWIGIDIGKTSHHACAINQSGKVVWSTRVSNDQASIEALLKRAESLQPVTWSIDMTSGESALLTAILLAAEHRCATCPVES